MKKNILLLLIFLFAITVKPLKAESIQKSESYVNFTQGWNLYSHAYETNDNGPIMASELIKSMNSQGGLVSTISRYQEGKYEDFVFLPNGQTYGEDFQVEIGKSYFVLNYKAFTYHLYGTAPTSWKVSLGKGYNFVGLPSLQASLKSSSLIQKFVSIDSATRPEISRFYSGLFETTAVKDGKIVGKDFGIGIFTGLIIKSNNAVTLDF